MLSAMPPTLATARLLLTPVEDADLAALHAHWNDPQVGRFLWDACPRPRVHGGRPDRP
jgi:RimJ/RimL family protein N-acetyltransferase